MECEHEAQTNAWASLGATAKMECEHNAPLECEQRSFALALECEQRGLVNTQRWNANKGRFVWCWNVNKEVLLPPGCPSTQALQSLAQATCVWNANEEGCYAKRWSRLLGSFLGTLVSTPMFHRRVLQCRNGRRAIRQREETAHQYTHVHAPSRRATLLLLLLLLWLKEFSISYCRFEIYVKFPI